MDRVTGPCDNHSAVSETGGNPRVFLVPAPGQVQDFQTQSKAGEIRLPTHTEQLQCPCRLPPVAAEPPLDQGREILSMAQIPEQGLPVPAVQERPEVPGAQLLGQIEIVIQPGLSFPWIGKTRRGGDQRQSIRFNQS